MKTQKNNIYTLLFTILLMQHSFAQTATAIEKLPVNIVSASSDTSKPLVLYITGDGGWNKFSKNLSQSFARNGYPVVALNAKEYFWKKKTAAQTALDITQLIKTYQKIWNRKKIILLGYSFGADVMPFVFNLLPVDVSAQIVNINLLSPGTNTDFEIHISVMLGASFTGGEKVVGAINKITSKPLVLVLGNSEKDFPLNQLTIKNYIVIKLDGGHHYDGDEANVCNTIISHFPKK